MKILYFDCFSGISGDMTLGALIDIGVDPNYLISELKKLPINDEFELKVQKGVKMGISGTKVDVILTNGEHTHDNHANENHGHDKNHEHNHHEHRNLESIESIISTSSLNKQVKDMSMKIFMEVAMAEAKVHDKPINEVHFHEVGAIDSIVDIVGTAICLDYLQVDKIMASTVELGGGFVRCAHGVIPVPAPATSEILKGIPVHIGRVNSETTTPTGAAILKATVHEFSDDIKMQIDKTAYGLGTKEFKIPNVLRVFLAEIEESDLDDLIMFETNIDDMNPEIYSYVEELLFDAGAKDVYKTNIIMKKGRPAVKLSVLLEKSLRQVITEILFLETTSLGLREFDIKRIALERNIRKIPTPYGDISVKISMYNGKVIGMKPEYEECKKIAKAKNIPLRNLYSEIEKLIAKEQY